MGGGGRRRPPARLPDPGTPPLQARARDPGASASDAYALVTCDPAGHVKALDR